MTEHKQAPLGATIDASAEQLPESARNIGALIQQHIDETERARRVAKPVLQALSGAGFQSMLTPRSLGGLDRRANLPGIAAGFSTGCLLERAIDVARGPVRKAAQRSSGET